MNIFITYSNEKYARARDFAIKKALDCGRFDKAIGYSPDSIDNNFKQKNSRILSIKRGGGLWLWKPYVIRKALIEECNDGDVLFYSDSGAFFFRSVLPLVKSFNSYIQTYLLPYIEEEFTKKETIEALDANEESITKTPQRMATMMMIRKCDESLAFIEEWLEQCQHYELISPVTNFGNQISNFVSHREDQSIFSILAKKHGIASMPDPSLCNLFGMRKYKGVEFIPTGKAEYHCIVMHKRTCVTPLTLLKHYKNLFINYVYDIIGYEKDIPEYAWRKREEMKNK